MKYIIGFFLVVTLLQCSQLIENGDGPLKFLPPTNFARDANPPVITGTWPLQDQSLVDPCSVISVSFSKDMNHAFTESSFSLRNNGNPIDGTFEWNFNTMFFIPQPRLDKSGTYNFTILKSKAESSAGANLLYDHTVRFNYNPDVTEPVLSNTIPANGSTGISPNAKIVLKFSKGMDNNTVLNGVSSSPNISFNLAATAISEGDSRYEFTPLQPLTYGTVYSITIANSIKDKAGNSLLQSYSISFTVGSDFTSPTITNLTTPTITANFANNEFTTLQGFEKTDGIIVTFSEPVLPSTILSGISFSPSVTFQATDVSGGAQTRFNLQPTSNLDINQVYQIIFNNQIKDMQNNGLAKTYTYNIQINGPRSQFLHVYNVYTNAALTAPLSINNINLLAHDGGGGPNYDFAAAGNGFYILFCRGMTLATCDVVSNPRDLAIVLATLELNVNFDFGVNPGSPYLSVPVNVTPLVPPDSFLFKTMLYSAANYPTTYQLLIKGGSSGVLDTYGNYMENDFYLRFSLTP